MLIKSRFLLGPNAVIRAAVGRAERMEDQRGSKPPEKNNPIYPTMHLFTFPASLWMAGGFEALSASLFVCFMSAR